MRAVLKEIFQERKEVGKEKEEVESLKFAILFTINTLSWNIYISSRGGDWNANMLPLYLF